MKSRLRSRKVFRTSSPLEIVGLSAPVTLRSGQL